MKSILVHSSNDDQFDARLDIACELAQSEAAHLVAVHALPNPEIPMYTAQAYVPQDLIDLQMQYAESDAKAAHERFVANTGRHGIDAEWRQATGNAGRIVSLHARYSDITVVGQGQAELGGDPGLACDVAMRSARPVLVVPQFGAYHDIGKRILVCWNASREATRAVTDAMPLLQKAELVTVLPIVVRIDREHGAVPGADISHYLARHGVRAEANRTFADDIEVGELILSRAADFGADLIVMGAYGHSRFQEWVFGGVTRTVMSSMTRPVLISH